MFSLGQYARVTANAFARGRSEFFAAADPLFDIHVLEFAGLKDFPAILAFNEFAIFIAADDLHTRVLARLLVRHV
jgi:hypothetical protein